MAKRTDSLAFEFILVAVAQAATLIGGFVTIKLLSNMLSKPEFAIFSLLFSVSSLLVSSLYVPLGQINMRFLVLEQQEGDITRFYSTQRILVLGISVISMVILAASVVVLRSYTGQALITFLALVFLTLAMGCQSFQQFLLMAYRQRLEGSITQMIGAVARPLCVFLAIAYLGYQALPATYGLALGFAILSLSQFLFLPRPTREATRANEEGHARVAPKGATLGRYVSYGAFYAIQGTVSAVVIFADRWLLSALGTLEQLAIFSALMQVAFAMMSSSFAVLTRFAAPIYFATGNKPKDVQDRQFWTLMQLWGGLCTAILAVCSVFHHEIVLLLTNQSFAAYSYLLPWMVLGLGLERTAQVLELKGGLKLATKVYLYPRLLMIALVPLIEWLFLRLLGFEGLVYGLVMATSIGLCCTAAVNHLRLREL